MKHITHIFLFIMLLGLAEESVLAHDIAVQNADGVTVYYNYIKNRTELAVTFKGESQSMGEYFGTIDIPEVVTYNGKTLPVTAIGDFAFEGCRSLNSVHIPESVTTIGEGAFSGSGVRVIEIPHNVTRIGRCALLSAYNVVSWSEEPADLTEVDSVFNPNVDYLYIPLGSYKRYDKAGWTEYRWDERFDFVKDRGIYYEIYDNEATVIESPYGYQGDIMIPSEITYQGVNYPVKDMYSAFWGCTDLTSISLPESMISISIEGVPFYCCTGLKQIIIPNRVEYIGREAFRGCSNLSTLILGSSIQKIRNKAFYDCTNLDDITCYAKVPPIMEEEVFSVEGSAPDAIYQYATLHVPEGREQLYREAEGWNKFKNIVSIDKDVTLTLKDGEQGDIREIVKSGEYRTVHIKPNDGYSIHSATFNNIDITNRLGADGVFVTPVLTEDATLYVVFEREGNSVKSLCDRTPVHISARKGEVLVDGLPSGELIEVYTIDGQVCSTIHSTGSQMSIHLNANQTYIVKAAYKVVKVRI